MKKERNFTDGYHPCHKGLISFTLPGKCGAKNIYIADFKAHRSMENDFREKRAKNYAVMRSLLDFTMGILYLAAAAFLFFAERFGFEMDNFDKTFRYIFGGLCSIYGLWRIYRGYKKDYFTK